MASRHQHTSEIRKPRPEPNVLAFIAGTSLDELYISSVTLAELRFGIDLLSHGSTQQTNLTHWLTQTIRPMFNNRVLPVTEDIMFRWRVLMEEGRKTGHTYSQRPYYCRRSLGTWLYGGNT